MVVGRRSRRNVMLHLRLNKVIEARLNKLCKAKGRSKDYYLKQAIVELLDDHEDYSQAVAVLQKKEPTVSLAELEQQLDPTDGSFLSA